MGFILWEGKSQLDKQPIVVICTDKSENIKTGNMIQTWILLQNINPVHAVQEGNDKSICGDCKLRKTICYVALHQAPLNVWRHYKDGKYEKPDDPYPLFKDKLVRFASYGDITAVPYKIWKPILKICAGYTAYSHQFSKPRFQKYKSFAMASCDSLKDKRLAESLGWRSFRLKNAEDKVLKGEIVCPASHEAGQKTTCAKCLMCNGSNNERKPFVKKNIVINIHGLPFKINNFKELTYEKKGLVSLQTISN